MKAVECLKNIKNYDFEISEWPELIVFLHNLRKINLYIQIQIHM